MSYQKIEETFWTDPKVYKLSPQEKLLFIYLITNSHVHYSGLYYLPKVIIVDETGLPLNTIDKALVSLTDGMLIRYDTDKKVIWVINMATYQVTQGNKTNLIKGFASQFNKLHKSLLIKEFLIHYQSLVNGILNPSEWDTEPMPESVALNNSSNNSSSSNKEHIVELHAEIIKDLNEVLGTNYRSTTKDIQKLLQSRLNDKFTLEDFKTVHRNMLQAWGTDLKMRDYLRPHTLYTEKFQSYLNKRPPSLSQQGVVSEKTEKNIEVLNRWLANEESKDKEMTDVK